MKRKEFIKQSVLIAGAGMTYPTYASLLNRSAIIGANDRLRFGAIGINGMGWADTKALLKVPNVVLRDKTERPETIESGSTIISMNNKLDILNSIKFSTENNSITDDVQGYHDLNVSKKILNIILSNYAFDK